jgi:hypothetical protein
MGSEEVGTSELYILMFKSSKEKRKKEKKSKKEKKEKKHHKQKSKDTETFQSEEQWVVVSDANSNLASITSKDDSAPKTERESWMVAPPTRDKKQSDKRDTNEQEEKDKQTDAPQVSSRELNPYMKEGLGVPKDKEVESKPEAIRTVGDGGAGWRSKILARVKQQALEEGKSMEEVADNRWDVKQLEKSDNQSVKRSNKGNYSSSDYLKDQRHKMMVILLL